MTLVITPILILHRLQIFTATLSFYRSTLGCPEFIWQYLDTALPVRQRKMNRNLLLWMGRLHQIFCCRQYLFLLTRDQCYPRNVYASSGLRLRKPQRVRPQWWGNSGGVAVLPHRRTLFTTLPRCAHPFCRVFYHL